MLARMLCARRTLEDKWQALGSEDAPLAVESCSIYGYATPFACPSVAGELVGAQPIIDTFSKQAWSKMLCGEDLGRIETSGVHTLR